MPRATEELQKISRHIVSCWIRLWGRFSEVTNTKPLVCSSGAAFPFPFWQETSSCSVGHVQVTKWQSCCHGSLLHISHSWQALTDMLSLVGTWNWENWPFLACFLLASSDFDGLKKGKKKEIRWRERQEEGTNVISNLLSTFPTV